MQDMDICEGPIRQIFSPGLGRNELRRPGSDSFSNFRFPEKRHSNQLWHRLLSTVSLSQMLFTAIVLNFGMSVRTIFDVHL